MNFTRPSKKFLVKTQYLSMLKPCLSFLIHFNKIAIFTLNLQLLASIDSWSDGSVVSVLVTYFKSLCRLKFQIVGYNCSAL